MGLAPLMENAPVKNNTDKTSFSALHIDTHHQTMHNIIICLTSPMCTSILRAKWRCPHKNCTPLKRWQALAWAIRRLRPRWACRSRRRSGGCAAQRHSAQHTSFDIPWKSPLTQKASLPLHEEFASATFQTPCSCCEILSLVGWQMLCW